MASGSKVNNAYTDDPGTSKGKSAGQKKSGDVLTSFPQDNVHGLDLPETRGGSFGGSTTNLGHSLSGASAVQKGPSSAGGHKSPKIPNH